MDRLRSNGLGQAEVAPRFSVSLICRRSTWQFIKVSAAACIESCAAAPVTLTPRSWSQTHANQAISRSFLQYGTAKQRFQQGVHMDAAGAGCLLAAAAWPASDLAKVSLLQSSMGKQGDLNLFMLIAADGQCAWATRGSFSSQTTCK